MACAVMLVSKSMQVLVRPSADRCVQSLQGGLSDMYLDAESIAVEEVHGVYVVPPDEWY